MYYDPIRIKSIDTIVMSNAWLKKKEDLLKEWIENIRKKVKTTWTDEAIEKNLILNSDGSEELPRFITQSKKVQTHASDENVQVQQLGNMLKRCYTASTIVK